MSVARAVQAGRKGRLVAMGSVLAGSLLIVPMLRAQVSVVQSGKATQWRYLDDGSRPPAEWQTAAFNATDWKLGAAPLGYGDGGMNTTVQFGDNARNKHPTTYFRKCFIAPEPAEAQMLKIRVRCDDGAVVFLNGKEVCRDNMPGGEVIHDTLASSAAQGAGETEFLNYYAGADLLLSGTNTIAVEVHQARRSSSDLAFDLELVVYRATDEQPYFVGSTPKLQESAKDAVDAYFRRHYVPANLSIPDGYVDGGSYMRIHPDGRITSNREVLVVDRTRDKHLVELLALARSDELTALPPQERAQKLAKHVGEYFSTQRARHNLESFLAPLHRRYRGKEILIGDVKTICNAGVCRHRALLYKMMGDVAGLKVTLVRGRYQSRGHLGKHAWNEVHLDDGTVLLVDATIPQPGYRLPATTEAPARRYHTINRQPKYGTDSNTSPTPP